MDAEKEWWETRRETIKQDFMKELDDEKTSQGAKEGAEEDGVLVDVSTPSKKKKGKK